MLDDGWSLKNISPSEGCSNPDNRSNSVDLPAPDGPDSSVISPALKVALKSAKIFGCCSLYRNATCLASIEKILSGHKSPFF